MVMFMGQAGIGKTASFILYSILINHVTSYYMTLKEKERQ